MGSLLALIVRYATPEEVQVFAGLAGLSTPADAIDRDEAREMVDHIDLLLAARVR